MDVSVSGEGLAGGVGGGLKMENTQVCGGGEDRERSLGGEEKVRRQI